METLSLQKLVDKACQMALSNEWGEKAYKVNRAILKIDKNNCSAYTRLAKYYKLNNNIVDAKMIYLKVLEIDPQNRGAINNLNDFEKDHKENEELCSYNSVAELIKEGQKSMIKGKYRFASKLFLKAYSIEPSVSCALSLAQAYNKIGKSDEVERLYTSLLTSSNKEIDIDSLKRNFSSLGLKIS